MHFEKAAVHELSLTAIPCNPEAMITAFKSLHAAEDAQTSEVPGETAEVKPEGTPEGTAANPSNDAAVTTPEAKSVTRETLAPFFYPSL